MTMAEGAKTGIRNEGRNQRIAGSAPTSVIMNKTSGTSVAIDTSITSGSDSSSGSIPHSSSRAAGGGSLIGSQMTSIRGTSSSSTSSSAGPLSVQGQPFSPQNTSAATTTTPLASTGVTTTSSSGTTTVLMPSGTTLSDLKKHRSIARRSAAGLNGIIANTVSAVSSSDSKSLNNLNQDGHQFQLQHHFSRSSIHADAADDDVRDGKENHPASDHQTNWMNHSPTGNNNNIVHNSYSNNNISISTPVHEDMNPVAPASPTSVLKKFRSDPSEVYGGKTGSKEGRSDSKRGCCIIS